MRETIECFGQNMDDVCDDLHVLYHGVSRSLIFDSTFIKICGPLSTTAGLFGHFIYAFTQERNTHKCKNLQSSGWPTVCLVQPGLYSVLKLI